MMHSLLLAALLLAPPPTTAEPLVETIHGVEVADDYRWLEALEAESERVRDWTTAQNAWTREVLDALPGRAALEKRLASLMAIDRINAPTVRGTTWFHTERRGSRNQPVLMVRDGAEGADRVLLDPNTLDERGLDALDWYVPSPDGSLVAFGLSHAGDEMTVLHVVETATGRWLADEIPGKTEFGGWAPDGRSFLYGVLEDPGDAYSRAFRWHELGRHHRQDELLLRQEQPSRIPDARLSRDGRWIIVTWFEGWSKQDVLAADVAAWRRTGRFEPFPIAVGLDARFTPLFVHGDALYLHTTLDAPNGMVYGVDLLEPARDAWFPIMPERRDARLEGVVRTRSRLVATYTMNATSRVETFALDGRPQGPIELPGLGRASVSAEPDLEECFLEYESFDRPHGIWRVTPGGAAPTLWAAPEVDVDLASLQVTQEWCVSKDGTKVPMFLVRRAETRPDAARPTLVYGYGGFDQSMMPRFRATDLPFLEAGGLYVMVNLRGGGEFGESWHRAGMLESKQNVYDDLYAAVEHLVDAGWTTPDHVALLGGSNGGLLAGVAAVQRPDLFSGIVSAVPLLDMVRFPRFLMARFWIPEYGDPEESAAFRWLLAYSPYHNVEPGREYPAILFTAGENDNRVHPMHARKMAALMQARAANDPEADPILLWVDRDGGHGQGKPLSLRIRDAADIWSFIMWRTGAVR